MSYIEHLDNITYNLEQLLENPEFLSLLTSEEEIALDAAIDLFNSIADHLSPVFNNVPAVANYMKWQHEQDDEDEDVTIPFSKY